MLHKDDAELFIRKLRVGLELVHSSKGLCTTRNSHDTSDGDFQTQKAVLPVQSNESLFTGEGYEAHVCHRNGIGVWNVAYDF